MDHPSFFDFSCGIGADGDSRLHGGISSLSGSGGIASQLPGDDDALPQSDIHHCSRPDPGNNDGRYRKECDTTYIGFDATAKQTRFRTCNPPKTGISFYLLCWASWIGCPKKRPEVPAPGLLSFIYCFSTNQNLTKNQNQIQSKRHSYKTCRTPVIAMPRSHKAPHHQEYPTPHQEENTKTLTPYALNLTPKFCNSQNMRRVKKSKHSSHPLSHGSLFVSKDGSIPMSVQGHVHPFEDADRHEPLAQGLGPKPLLTFLARIEELLVKTALL
jgi:hypothetical protein